MTMPQVAAHRGSSDVHAENSWAASEAALADGADAVALWHEERESELRALVALRPDAICTNTPAVLRRIVDRHAARAKAEGLAATGD